MTLNRFLYFLVRKVLLHAFFWVAVFFFFSYLFGDSNEDFIYVSSFSAFLLPVTMVTTYTVIYFLVPKFLLPRKYLLFSLYSAYTLVLSAFAITLSVFYGMVFIMNLRYDGTVPISRSVLFMMVVVYSVVLLATAFSLVKQNYSSLAENKILENKFLEAQLKLKEQELSYLKMQIHPHFLFNTLNTMYGHALKKSKETPDMILKLSNLLDYLLYQVDKPMVSLANELEHLKDYISLEKMRFRDSLEVDFDIPNLAGDIYIAPMLLIPFVENSFKHGDIINGKLFVSISLKVEKERIFFSVKNSVKRENAISPEKGIGLENLEKRLNLLYKDNYTFSAEKNNDRFEANLSVNHTKLGQYE